MAIKAFFIFILALSFFLTGVWHSASAWQVAKCYITGNGFLAGSSPDVLKKGIEYKLAENKEKLDELIQDGRIIRLKENVKVQAVERSFEFKMLKIKFENVENGKSFYWVTDGSLTPIKEEK
jgi:hypothetical protein